MCLGCMIFAISWVEMKRRGAGGAESARVSNLRHFVIRVMNSTLPRNHPSIPFASVFEPNLEGGCAVCSGCRCSQAACSTQMKEETAQCTRPPAIEKKTTTRRTSDLFEEALYFDFRIEDGLKLLAAHVRPRRRFPASGTLLGLLRA